MNNADVTAEMTENELDFTASILLVDMWKIHQFGI